MKKGKKSRRMLHKKKRMIDKKCKATKKRMKKNAKKSKLKGLPKRRRKKSLGIPNLCPFKEELLMQIKNRRDVKEAEELVARLSKKRRREKNKRDRESMLAGARERAAQGKDMDTFNGDEEGPARKKQRRGWYYKDLNKVVDAADVVICVLDARDPNGSRSRQIEQRIISSQAPTTGKAKKLILLLNKIDLVPQHALESWSKVLRREFPTIAFKASTQAQKSNLSQVHIKAENITASSKRTPSSKCVGADTLIQLLKNYCRSVKIKTAITVCVIGYPNVGKSSVINSLKRSRAAGTSATPGYTTSLQEIKLDSNIILVDSPGVLFDESNESGLILKNSLRVEKVEAPVDVVIELVKRCPAANLAEIYNIPLFDSAQKFLFYVAQQRGKLKKGGVPDVEKAARLVLQDWNTGKIPYYVPPPDLSTQEPASVATTVVNGFSEEFDVDALLDANNSEAVSVICQHSSHSGFVAMQPALPESYAVGAPRVSKAKKEQANAVAVLDAAMADAPDEEFNAWNSDDEEEL